MNKMTREVITDRMLLSIVDNVDNIIDNYKFHIKSYQIFLPKDSFNQKKFLKSFCDGRFSVYTSREEDFNSCYEDLVEIIEHFSKNETFDIISDLAFITFFMLIFESEDFKEYVNSIELEKLESICMFLFHWMTRNNTDFIYCKEEDFKRITLEFLTLIKSE